MSFAEPLFLRVGALFVALVILGLWSHSRRRRRLAEYLGGRGTAARLSASNLYRRPLGRILLLALSAIALAAAAAGPRWNLPPVEPLPPPPERSFLIAIDVSASMQAADESPTRLARATQIASGLIEALPEERVGVLLFAGRVYPLAPPTRDHMALKYLLDGVTPTIASAHDPGSLQSGAIEGAVTILDRWSGEGGERSMILISDGDGGDSAAAMETAARAANDAGVRVHAIGVGSTAGARMVMPAAPFQLGGPIVDAQGAPAVTFLRSPLLTRAAEAGGGTYTAAADPIALAAFTESLAASAPIAAPVEEPISSWARVDPVFLLTSAALALLLLESLLDVRPVRSAGALVRRTA
ncbi:MAG: VWA domain-containing protein [Gemmatimonadota bacterium]